MQNLHWGPAQGGLVLVQNQLEGRRWRFTFVDLNESLAAGRQVVRKVVDLDKADELEGFTLLGNPAAGLAVTSSRSQNVHLVHLAW